MSSTSVSCRIRPLPHVGQALRRLLARRSSRRRPRSTRPGCGGPTRSGARCTSRGCSPSSRGRSSSHVLGDDARCGRRAPPAMACSASGLHLHEPLLARGRARRRSCSGSSGRPRARWSSTFSSSPCGLELLDERPCGTRSGPCPAYAPGLGRHPAVVVDDLHAAAGCGARPISKSFGSWAASPSRRRCRSPCPRSSSRDDRDLAVRPAAGSPSCPTRCPVALVLRVDRHGRVAEHGLGPGGGDDDAALARPRSG